MVILENSSVLEPLACPPNEDLSSYSLVELRNIGIHTLRRARNWGLPQPTVYGSIELLDCNGRLTFICQILGTEYVIFHCASRGTAECWNTKISSITAAVDIGERVFSISPAHKQNDQVSVALLVGNVAANGDAQYVPFWHNLEFLVR
jgi:hypothetical protein